MSNLIACYMYAVVRKSEKGSKEFIDSHSIRMLRENAQAAADECDRWFPDLTMNVPQVRTIQIKIEEAVVE